MTTYAWLLILAVMLLALAINFSQSWLVCVVFIITFGIGLDLLRKL